MLQDVLFTQLLRYSPPAPTLNLTYVSESISPGMRMNVSGGLFTSTSMVHVARVNSDGSLGTTIAPIITANNPNLLQVTIPLSFPYGLWAVWVTDGVNVSGTLYCNKAAPVLCSLDSVAPGDLFEIWGRNVCVAGSVTTVFFTDQATLATVSAVASVVEACHITVTVPATLATGRALTVTVSNGMGGVTGYGTLPQTLTTRTGGTDYAGLGPGVSWSYDLTYFTSYNPLTQANCYNVKTDSRLTTHAVGDGVTDDEPAIQAALNAAHTAGGGIVYCPGATYQLTSHSGNWLLEIPSNVILIGDGPNTTILQGGVNNSLYPGLVQFSGSACGVIGLTLTQLNTSGTAANCLLDSPTTTKFFMKDVTINFNNSKQSNLINSIGYFLMLGCTLNGTSIVQSQFNINIPWSRVDGCQIDYRVGRFTFGCGATTSAILRNTQFVRDGSYSAPSTYESGAITVQYNTIVEATNLEVTGNYLGGNGDGEGILAQDAAGRFYETVGVVTSADATSLTDSSQSWTSANLSPSGIVMITSGPAIGNWGYIGSMSGWTLTHPTWTAIPEAGDTYSVTGWNAYQIFVLGVNSVNGIKPAIEWYDGACQCTVANTSITQTYGNVAEKSVDIGGIYMRASDQPQTSPSVHRHNCCWQNQFFDIVLSNLTTNKSMQVFEFYNSYAANTNGVAFLCNDFWNITLDSVPDSNSGVKVSSSGTSTALGSIFQGMNVSGLAVPFVNSGADTATTVYLPGNLEIILSGVPAPILLPGQFAFVSGSGFTASTTLLLTNTTTGATTTLSVVLLSPTLVQVSIPASWIAGPSTLSAYNGVEYSASISVNASPGGTVAYLDIPRVEMTELPLSRAVKAKDIVTELKGHNLVYKWPGTGSYTLFPINFSTDFSAGNTWENIKLRLADFTYLPGWWTESPEGTRADLGPYDYYIHAKVLNSNLPTNFPYGQGAGGGLAQAPGGFVLGQMTEIAPPVNIPTYNLQTDNTVSILQSVVSYPENQGWCLRFYIDGRQTYKRTAILHFLFGQYVLSLYTDGMAQISVTPDGSANFLSLHNFQWTDDGYVHGRHHSIFIMPHGRQYIEILSQRQYLNNDWNQGVNAPLAVRIYSTLYALPGQPLLDTTTGNYAIVQPGPITLRAHQEFRPHLQVSKLAFTNGNPSSSAGPAYLYDAPFSLEFPPSINFSGNLDVDLNGGSASWGLVDVNTQALWTPGPNASAQIAFFVELQGIGDIAGPGLGSSTTPEFYAYALDKPPVYSVVARNPVAALPQTVSIDFGDTAESERATLTFDNSAGDMSNKRQGQLELFAQRGDIPIHVVDGRSGVVLFDGRSDKTKSREHYPRAITTEVQGMIEPFLRKTWTLNVPDFGIDPNDPKMRGWYVWDAVRRMFAAGGVSSNLVVIENEAAYSKITTPNDPTAPPELFRLWSEAGGGSTQAAGTSANHLAGSGSRFRPTPGRHIWESLKFLLYDMLGWHTSWDRLTQTWRVYKRPHPFVAAERAALTPKVAFYRNRQLERQAPDGIPSYFHESLDIETTKPRFSSIVLQNGLLESGLGTDPNQTGWQQAATIYQQELNAAMGKASATDPSLTVKDRSVIVPATNPLCYQSQFNPNPPGGPTQYNPDWLGEIRWGMKQVALPNREAMMWNLRMAYYALCFGQQAATMTADWGDPNTAYLRKWDLVLLDTGPNYEMEQWFIDRIEPKWESDQNRRATWRLNKLRNDCPPPY